MPETVTHHPAAAVWPMLPDAELQRLADDIAANGLRHPVVLDTEGRVLDGRNRLAACEIASVEPAFETYDGDDPEGYILSANNERRHMSLPERAAATALTLFQAGKRKDGRWEYGSLKDSTPNGSNPNNSSWRARMAEAGFVLDILGPGHLKRVTVGQTTLDNVVQTARAEKELLDRFNALPPELRELVEDGTLTVEDAERRNRLEPRFSKLVESGELTLDEAEALGLREEREYRESITRAKDAVESFLFGYEVARSLPQTDIREDVMDALSDHDRERYLTIAEDAGWTS